MKLNEKHVQWLAGSSAPHDKCGHLSKRGELNKAFQKRWFVLKGNLLFYYEKQEDKEPIGVIILEGCTVELSEMNDTNSFTFELVFQGTGSRTYILATDTQEEMEAWMKAITCANYDYMKLMVSELQRQWDELNAKEAAGSTVQQQQLIDLSVPDGGSATTASAQELDEFGATPFNPNVSGRRQPRTFREMHEEFGEYIKEKSGMAGHSVADCWGGSSDA